MSLWRVQGGTLDPVAQSHLAAEEALEGWLAQDVSLLGLELLIIGRQVRTPYGGRIDLLCIDAQGDCWIVELKRDRTPRDVVAQILDYGSWVKHLGYEELNSIAAEYLGTELASAFEERFEQPVPENVNVNHSMLVVASELDDSSQRIVEYLAEDYQVNINTVFFQVFEDPSGQFLGRAWLMDPETIQERAESRKQAPWTGYWFVNIGEGEHRTWEDNVRYGYIGAGQGPKYSNALKKLSVGDPIFAYQAGQGYLGYGIVTETAQMVKDFVVDERGRSLLEAPTVAPNVDENSEDPQLSEWAVRVDWKKTFPRSDSQYFKGAFANENVVCKLRHPQTIQFLESRFDVGQST